MTDNSHWRPYKAARQRAAVAAADVSSALAVWAQDPILPRRDAVLRARRAYDAAEDEASRRLLDAERATSDPDPAWTAHRATLEATRIALAAFPAEAETAAREARIAADAAATQQAKPAIRRHLLRAADNAHAAADTALARIAWPDITEEQPVASSQATLLAVLETAYEQAQAAADAARDALALARRATTHTREEQ